MLEYILLQIAILLWMVTEVVVENLPPFNDLLVLLGPIVVKIATTTANWIKNLIGSTGGFGGSVMVILVVPVLSLIVAYLTHLLVEPSFSIWIVFIINLVSVYINEVIKQIKQTSAGIQKKVK